ncbi:hypothetical protein [Halomontanus rarus]|uniref:hypothetical protein n=1 Tax=Halomontanus rarus TaxID=3034020 RepID=UPI0023E7C6ED|nr:hypothetical protein [Halovivax sp. TS33]
MTLKEKENEDVTEEPEQSREWLPVDDWERPDDWEPVSSDELPEPDYDEYPIPDPDELTEVPVNDS